MGGSGVRGLGVRSSTELRNMKSDGDGVEVEVVICVEVESSTSGPSGVTGSEAARRRSRVGIVVFLDDASGVALLDMRSDLVDNFRCTAFPCCCSMRFALRYLRPPNDQ